MGLQLLIHPDILFGFNIENAITTFSSSEASLFHKEGGENEKERAPGTMGKRKGRREAFSLFQSSPARLLYFDWGYPAGASGEEWAITITIQTGDA